MVNQQVKVGAANNDKMAKCWCGTGKVGVATATPVMRHSPPMSVSEYCICQLEANIART